MRALLWLMILALGVLGPINAAEAQERRLQGDPEAVAAVERMLERFGGREVWARARTLYVEYDGWRTDPNEPVIERAWRSFDQPMQRAEFEGRSFLTVSVLSPNRSWRSRNGEVTFLPDEEHRASAERYPFGFYSSLHTFAVADERVRVFWQAPNRVIVRSIDGRDRGWWEIDSTGAVIKWGAQAPDGRMLEYVYGPMRSFGNVDFPAWGASTDGWWRWDYVEVDVSTDPFSAPLTPPRG